MLYYFKEKGGINMDYNYSSQDLSGDYETKAVIHPDYHLRCGRDGVERFRKHPLYGNDNLLVIGMPRIDLLFKHKDCLRKLTKDKKYKKTILCMETYKQSKHFNDSTSTHSYGINILSSISELEKLNHKLVEEDTLLLIKPHPYQDLSCISSKNYENILFIFDEQLKAKDIQLYELLENTDALITDYSSVYYDYLLLNRPIGFTIGDMEEYRRGFIIPDPIGEMPGEKIKCLEDLFAFIEHVSCGIDDFSNERHALINNVFDYPDDKNSERLYKFLIENGLEA